MEDLTEARLTEARLIQLMIATKDGKSLHPGLKGKKCEAHWRGSMIHPSLEITCTEVGCSGYVPNLDPYVLMAAAHDREWQVTSARSEIGGKTVVEIDTKSRDFEIVNVHAYTLEVALIEAMHEATVEEADNLVECGCTSQSESFKQIRHEQDGVDCAGTGYVVRED